VNNGKTSVILSLIPLIRFIGVAYEPTQKTKIHQGSVSKRC
jgi:hypothetical protein